MNPDAADPLARRRIDAGTRVLADATAIWEQLCAVLDDLDRYVHVWPQEKGGEPDDRGP